MLLVDDREGEVLEFDMFLKDRVRADDDGKAAIGERAQDFVARLAFDVAGQQRHRDGREFLEHGEMLLGEDFGRRQQGGLRAGFDGAEHRQEGHQGFAGADIALQQAQHLVRGGEVGIDFGDRLELPGGGREAETLQGGGA